MYCDFFSLSEKPFDVTPDPKFLYLTPQHQEALASLVYGIRERRGFIVLVGEVGTGKTTLLNAALDRLDEQTMAAYIFNTRVDFDALLNSALVDLGASDAHEFLPSWEAVNRLNRFAIDALAKGKNVVLIVDEAQNLEPDCMESLRLLSNLETRKHKLIQMVFSGQPELSSKLEDPQLRQLTQRISLRRYISHMSEEDTYAYMQHRLDIAQYKGPSLFSRDARQRIWTYSGGIPRKINILCDNALLTAYGLKKRKIGLEIVEEAIRDLGGMPPSGRAEGVPAKASPSFRSRTDAPAKRKIRPGFVLAFAASLSLFLTFTYRPRLADRPIEHLVFWISGGQQTTEASNVRAPIVKKQAAQAAVPADPAPDENLTLKAETEQPRGAESRSDVADDRGPEAEVPVDARTTQSEPAPAVQVPASPADKAGRPSVVPPESVETPEEKPPETIVADQTVVVRDGDTLSSILARAYGRYSRATALAVQEINPGLKDPNHIAVGQTIRLPAYPQSRQEP